MTTGHNMYKIVKTKIKCYPLEIDMCVTENSVTIELQSLLDLTAKNLILS